MTRPCRSTRAPLAVVVLGFLLLTLQVGQAQVQVGEGSVTLPTYAWEADENPKFWALEPGTRGALVYPYTMQDHLSRTRSERTYQALFLENEYLKVTCLPELGGRIHSVLDKTTDREMFYLNHVVKPSMIAMRGAWISGGVEWNAGPQGHTVTCVSPVNALTGRNADGSAYLEISNLEQSQRTRWTVRVTLHPGRAYLDERIRLFNPTDALSPYYFWNCTAFPCRPGTRFMFPMSLGTDHARTKFFTWPIHEDKDLTWLKNYDTWASIFAVDCTFDFFGAYDVDMDRGIVQAADHAALGGKKAWTWGTWEFGLVSEQNLTDEDGPYIEVQSGPLPTQSDYGALWPRDAVTWQEWWYPVHDLGNGFEFATRDVAIQTIRENAQLELRILATGEFPGASCTVIPYDGKAFLQHADLSPREPARVIYSPAPDGPVNVTVSAADGEVLACFESPLPVPQITPPTISTTGEQPAGPASAEELYLKGRKADLASNRVEARESYEQALAADPGHVAALRGLAVLDLEAGLYADALPRLEQALRGDSNDGWSWYFQGVCHLRLDNSKQALRCAQRAADCPETAALGQDLAGRACMRLKRYSNAAEAFTEALRRDPADTKAQDHLLLALFAGGQTDTARAQARARVVERPTELIPRAVLALQDDEAMHRFASDARGFAGDLDFEMIEAGLSLAEVGLYSEAARLLLDGCVAGGRPATRGSLPLYYAAWFAAQQGDESRARAHLAEAARLSGAPDFPSRPEAIPVLEYAVRIHPADARAQLHLGNAYGGLGRIDEAVPHWQEASTLDASQSIAFRNLGLHAWKTEHNLTKAAELYRTAIAARPADQTLYRDLAAILVADGQSDAAIAVLESIPTQLRRRADALLALADLYVKRARFTAAIELLESAPRFVNWEGDGLPWVLFHRAHVGRGRQRLEDNELDAALRDFEAALTYPENLGVGQAPEHERAAAHFWRGKTLAALGQSDAARAAWQCGAAEHEGSDDQNQYREMCRAALASEP